MQLPVRCSALPLLTICVGVLAGAALWLAPSARATGIDDVELNVAPVQPQGRHIVIGLRAGADEVVSIAAGGSIRQGGHDRPLHRATASVAPGKLATLELRPRRHWQERRIKRALRKGRTLGATIRVRYEDLLGNVATRRRSVKLR